MLDHPGIVKAHDFFEGTFASTLVLDYVPGKSLNELVSQLADHSPSNPVAHEFRYQQAEHV
jgi:serine/threonine protein kinase